MMSTLRCPAFLCAVPAWVMWRYEQKANEPKPRKVPYYVNGRRRGGPHGSKTDRAQLATFDAAREAAIKRGMDGVGFCPLDGASITVIDLDNCAGRDGQVHEEAERLVAGTYAEFSPSGGGAHAFFAGEGLGNRKDAHGKPFGLEIFSTKGFVTFTGRALPITDLTVSHDTIADITPELRAYCAHRFGRGEVATPAAPASPTAPLGLTEEQLREALEVLDPDMSHDDWLTVGMALHHETSGERFDLWDDWSSPGGKYPGTEALRARWDSFGRGGQKPTTAHALVRMANVQGGRIETAHAETSGDFEALVVAPSDPPPPPAFKRNKAGEILATVENVVLALRRSDVCAISLGYDTFRDELMLAPEDQPMAWAPFGDADYTRLRMHLEKRRFKPIGRDLIRDAVALVGSECQFDSAQLWVNALQWDGVERVARFYADYFGAEDSEYARAVSTYTWTAMAGRVLDPGCQADMVTVLIGPQGTRKTSGTKAMVPSPEHFVGVNLEVRDADTARLLRGVLVAEIGELRGLHTRDAESIKDFISRTHEKWVPKFREFTQSFPRRVVFIGTTNQDEFLADETGNRRWLPLRVTWCEPARVAADHEQLWAEAAALWLAGGIAYQAAQELAPEVHSEHLIGDAWEEPVRIWLRDAEIGEEAARGDRPFRLDAVLRGALGFDLRSYGRREELRLGRVLRTLGYQKRVTRTEEGLRKAWYKDAEICTQENAGSVTQVMGNSPAER